MFILYFEYRIRGRIVRRQKMRQKVISFSKKCKTCVIIYRKKLFLAPFISYLKTTLLTIKLPVILPAINSFLLSLIHRFHHLINPVFIRITLPSFTIIRKLHYILGNKFMWIWTTFRYHWSDFVSLTQIDGQKLIVITLIWCPSWPP